MKNYLIYLNRELELKTLELQDVTVGVSQILEARPTEPHIICGMVKNGFELDLKNDSCLNDIENYCFGKDMFVYKYVTFDQLRQEQDLFKWEENKGILM